MIIYEFQKNALEKVRVELGNYRGQDVINIRVYYLADIARDEWKPSLKGVTLRIGALDELKKAIDKAYKKRNEENKAYEEEDEEKQYLSLLRNCNGYPFNKMEDSWIFRCTKRLSCDLNIIEMAKKKIDRWKEHPEELNDDPRLDLWREFESQIEAQKLDIKEKK